MKQEGLSACIRVNPWPESGSSDSRVFSQSQCAKVGIEPQMGSFRKIPVTTAPQPGLIVFAHGSRIESANEAVRSVARELSRTGNFPQVEAAFLELGRPDLSSAVALLAKSGCLKIVVLPYFLTLGLHMERDLPRLIADISLAHKGLEILVAPPLDGHPALIEVLRDRAQEALEKT